MEDASWYVQLLSLERLKENWDSQGARPLTNEIINRMMHLLHSLGDMAGVEALEYVHVAAFDGGVTAELKWAGMDLEFDMLERWTQDVEGKPCA